MSRSGSASLRWVLTAHFLSGIAQGISLLAVPWYFINERGDPGTFGWVYAGCTAAMLFWGPYAGTLIDRYPKRSVFVAVHAAGAGVLGLAAGWGYVFGEVPDVLTALVFCTTIAVFNIHFPCLYAFVQETTSGKQRREANALVEICFQVTTIVAGSLAAVLLVGLDGTWLEVVGLGGSELGIAQWQLRDIFLLDGLTYLLAVALLARLPKGDFQVRRTSSYFSDLIEGLWFLRANPLLLSFGVASLSMFVVFLIHSQNAAPLYIGKHLGGGAGVYAVGELFYAVGALMMGSFISVIASRFRVVGAAISLLAMGAVALLALAVTRSVAVFMGVSFVIGLSNAGVRVQRMTYLFEHVPPGLMGRGQSALNTIGIGVRLALIGMLTWVPALGAHGITWAYAGAGGLVLGTSMLLLWHRRRLESLGVVEPQGPAARIMPLGTSPEPVEQSA